ncbi:MAG: SDR family oxidoreductase [Candidatus Cybelea sp.]
MGSMRVLVTGSTGYIGGRLVPRLRDAGLEVRCLARAVGRLRGRFGERVEIVEGNLDDAASLVTALKGCDVAYYLVHSMAATADYAEVDRKTARQFGAGAREAGVKAIVYLGGLGEDGDSLSAHLRSRHEVGGMLRGSGVPVIEFRAAQIIGSGSISFEMMRYLTERLPVMIAPRWVTTRCQPVGIRDVLAYLIAALSVPRENRIYEIGGRDVLTYREMMLRYAAIRGLKRWIVVVPFFSPTLSSYWVHLITPVPAKLAQPLIKGLYNEVVVRDSATARDFPQIAPMGFDDAVRLAFDRSRSADRETTWFDAFSARAPHGDFAGLQEGMLIDRRVGEATASPARVAAIFSSLGGKRGWFGSQQLWRIRGWMDRWVGGVGLRLGRRSANDLRVGDAVDFWRVEAYEPGHLLRLRAEMRLPGRAWLQFEAEPRAGNGSTFVQTAFFEPRGLGGYLYWYSVAPFHAAIFGNMAKRIIEEAAAPAS